MLRYNSTHTLVLAAAMDAFLKQKVGPNAHLWDMVTSEVLEPIGIFHAPMMHTVDLHMRDRWGTVSLRRTAGNPERY